MRPFAPRVAPTTPDAANPAAGRRNRSSAPETTHLPIHELIGLLSTGAFHISDFSDPG